MAEINGVIYIDDSKGTNVGATLAAIEGMGRKVAIVLGGEGKGQDFSPLQSQLCEKHGRAIALIGRDAAAIGMALEGSGVPTRILGDMADAVRWLAAQAESGDCVLLSPACASLDMYRNYAHRAQAFIDAVQGLSS
jgi:UDP-N-acetylmuramoylalanine--D-glutamate ligase